MDIESDENDELEGSSEYDDDSSEVSEDKT